MKIYIAGRIKGNPGYKRDFEAGVELVHSLHAEAVNPADAPQGWSYKRYIDTGLALLKECDAILLLPGWNQSKGATLERHYAGTVGMLVIETVRENGKLKF